MIKRELGIFLFVGAMTVLIDFVAYRGLIRFDIVNVNMAKAMGFLFGTLFAYFANRFWTFGHKSPVSGSAWRFAILYASTLVSNVLINSIALKLTANNFVALAFLLATGVSASMNFLGMKLFVFKQRAF